MAARSAWRGAITFGGFPINVAAYNPLKSKSGESFKNLCPCHQQPIVMPKRCAVTDDMVDTDDCLKGHEVSRGQYVVIDPEAVAAIADAERSVAIEILRMPERSTVPIEMSTAHLRLVPDEKVPGSDQGVQLMWNGLRKAGRVIISEVTLRAGSRPQLMAVDADTYGLLMHSIPRAADLQATPEFNPVENAQAGEMFEQFASIQGLNMDPFSPDAFPDRYRERREALIAKALAGETITVAAAETKPAAAPDLMAAMAAALEAAKAPKPKPRSKSRAKASA